jgi:hypothetical protein
VTPTLQVPACYRIIDVGPSTLRFEPLPMEDAPIWCAPSG